MANFRIEKLDADQIIKVTTLPDFDPSRDAATIAKTTAATLSLLKEPADLIIDRTQSAAIDLEDATVGATAAALSPSSPFRHPMVRRIIVATNDPILAATYEGMKAPVYGNLDVYIFATIEAALSFAHADREPSSHK